MIASGQVILLLDGFDEISAEFTEDDLLSQIRYLADYIPQESKTIIATRGTRFPSLSKIFDLFQGRGATFREKEKGKISDANEQYIPSATSRKYVKAYRVCKLDLFSPDDFVNLKQEENTKKLVAKILEEKNKRNFIEEQCCQLASIPACARDMINLMKEGIQNNLHLYEMALINQLIKFNIETGRANVEIGYIDKSSGKDVLDKIGLIERIRILEYIAWMLLEIGQDEFDPELIKFSYLEIDNMQFEAVLNDLRGQTVFESCYDRKLKFLSNSIRAYFTARYIFSKLAYPDTILEGLKCLGPHNFAGESSIQSGDLIIGFLSLFCDRGMLNVGKMEYYYPQAADQDITIFIEKNNLQLALKNITLKKAEMIPWMQYLAENLQKLDLPVEESEGIAKWAQLKQNWKKNKLNPYVTDGILIASEKGSAFCIAQREVTNLEFSEFLYSDLKPILMKPRQSTINQLQVTFSEDENIVHPLLWESIHLGSADSDQRFKKMTNDYHLFHWVNGKSPRGGDYHPVCWLSAYVIAIFCNWKTWRLCLENGLDHPEEELAYTIILEKSGYPKLILNHQTDTNQPKSGYRMPTHWEWKYAARGGDWENEYIWEQYISSENQRFQRKGRLLKEHLTKQRESPQSVISSMANGFGIYGMIGNVREWVFLPEDDAKDNVQKGQIMGATAVLGQKTFKYEHEGSALPMFNTNLDVGFRWVRSIPNDIQKDLKDFIAPKF